MNFLKVEPDLSLFDKGLYTVAEASALARVAPATLKRWLFGYTRNRDGGPVDYHPVARPELGRIEDTLAIGFRDLLEVRVVHAFRTAGVSWPVIRAAARNVPTKNPHPFLATDFRTDGRTIFRETVKASGDPELLDLARNQHAFHAVVSPSLFKQIEFDNDDLAVRWYPLWPKRAVVLDPTRAFGRPTVANIPADTLAAAARAEQSEDAAARWFNVSVEQVNAAVSWQDGLGRAA